MFCAFVSSSFRSALSLVWVCLPNDTLGGPAKQKQKSVSLFFSNETNFEPFLLYPAPFACSDVDFSYQLMFMSQT